MVERAKLTVTTPARHVSVDSKERGGCSSSLKGSILLH